LAYLRIEATVLHPGSASFDSAKDAYTITGSGEIMWFGIPTMGK
jgi:hypothetical protein